MHGGRTRKEGGSLLWIRKASHKIKLMQGGGSYPPLPTLGTTLSGNTPGKFSYANVICELSKKDMNIRTLFTPGGNEIDVVVSAESIRAISERFVNTAYGFFLGKRVAYPVVANYVRNTWGKFGLVKSMLNSSTGLFFFQFSSTDGLNLMLENGPCDDGLSAIATKLGTPLMLDSYTSDMCLQSWGRSSYAKVMIELRADVELKDSIVVAMPKIMGEGYYTCTVRVEYEWKPLMSLCLGFKPHKEYRPVAKKPTASSSGNKKKGVEPINEVSNSNPFEVLNSVDNDVELGTNGETTNLVTNEANLSGPSFMNVDNSSTILTPVNDKIRKFEDLLIDGQDILVDEDCNHLKKVEYPGDDDSEDEVASVGDDLHAIVVRFDRNHVQNSRGSLSCLIGNTFLKIGAKWGEVLDLEEELFTWSPSFSDVLETAYSSDDESAKDEGINQFESSEQVKLEEESDDEVVSDTHFGETRRKMGTSMNCSRNNWFRDTSIPFPPGFTPNIESPKEDEQHLNMDTVPSQNREGGSIWEVIRRDDYGWTTWGFSMKDAIKIWRKLLVHKEIISEALGNSGGILCAWDNNVLCKEHHTISDNFIAVFGTWIPTKMKVMIISVYAPQADSYKRALWSYLELLVNRWNGESIIMGDFNEVRRKEERWGSTFNAHGARVFNNFISNAGLVDLQLEGFSFTWSHPSALQKMCKLDRFLVGRMGYISFIPHISAVVFSSASLGSSSYLAPVRVNSDFGATPFRLYHSCCTIKKEEIEGGMCQVFEDKLSDIDSILDKGAELEDANSNEEIVNAVLGVEKKNKYPGRMVYFLILPPNIGIIVGRSDFCLDVDGFLIMDSFSVGCISSCNALYPEIFRHEFEVKVLKDQGIDFLSHCKIKIGNGRCTRFWTDLWIGDDCFCHKFPRLYALEVDKDCYVDIKLKVPVASSFRRMVRGGVEASQLAQLNDILGSVSVSNSEDRWVWDMNGDGVFRVKDVRNLLDETFLPKSDSPTRWVRSIPIKINIFAWKVSLDRLPTRVNLVHRGVLVSPISCPIGCTDQEDSNHILFRCDMAVGVTRLVCRWWNQAWIPFDSYHSWFVWFNSIRLSANSKGVLEGVFYVMWWSIWIFRNQLLFAAKKPRKDVLFDDIVLRSFNWCSARSKCTFRWDSWIQHPYLISL
ncbi:RNA-directed DNA polymerase, eukaryota [Tanacetum coccineum]